MDLRITLAPDGGLRLLLPAGRALDIGATSSTMHFIQRILKDAGEGKRERRGYIGEFPTQHVIDLWQKQDAAAKEEARAERIAAEYAKAAEQAERAKEEFAAKGIDLEELEFRL